MKDIDFDELDRAVGSVLNDAENKTSTNDTTDDATGTNGNDSAKSPTYNHTSYKSDVPQAQEITLTHTTAPLITSTEPDNDTNDTSDDTSNDTADDTQDDTQATTLDDATESDDASSSSSNDVPSMLLTADTTAASSQPASSTDESQTVKPLITPATSPARQRGQFLDMVHPSANMRKGSTLPSGPRKSLTPLSMAEASDSPRAERFADIVAPTLSTMTPVAYTDTKPVAAESEASEPVASPTQTSAATTAFSPSYDRDANDINDVNDSDNDHNDDSDSYDTSQVPSMTRVDMPEANEPTTEKEVLQPSWPESINLDDTSHTTDEPLPEPEADELEADTPTDQKDSHPNDLPTEQPTDITPDQALFVPGVEVEKRPLGALSETKNSASYADDTAAAQTSINQSVTEQAKVEPEFSGPEFSHELNSLESDTLSEEKPPLEKPLLDQPNDNAEPYAAQAQPDAHETLPTTPAVSKSFGPSGLNTPVAPAPMVSPTASMAATVPPAAQPMMPVQPVTTVQPTAAFATTALGPQSIAQQYPSPSKADDDDDNELHRLFGNQEYHQPLLPAQTKSKRTKAVFWIILFFVLVLVGAALGYIAFTSGIVHL